MVVLHRKKSACSSTINRACTRSQDADYTEEQQTNRFRHPSLNPWHAHVVVASARSVDTGYNQAKVSWSSGGGDAQVVKNRRLVLVSYLPRNSCMPEIQLLYQCFILPRIACKAVEVFCSFPYVFSCFTLPSFAG